MNPVETDRLRDERDIVAVLRGRRQRAGHLAVLHVRSERESGPPRVAVVASRRVGNAVSRNRAKRLLREASRHVDWAEGTDLVLVWGEGADFPTLPHGVPVILMNAFLAPENGHADVFFPISVMTERRGSYSNFEGVRSAFEACFAPPPGVVHAAQVFEALAVKEAVTP